MADKKASNDNDDAAVSDSRAPNAPARSSPIRPGQTRPGPTCPEPSGPGRKRSEAKRQAILEAARATFLAQGYAGASMNAVADAAKVSKATLYSHFADKETLFAAMVEERYAAFAEALPAYDGTRDPADALADFARAMVKNIRAPEHAALIRLILGEQARFPVLSDIYFQKGKASAYARTESYIGALARDGDFDIPDTKLAAGIFLGGIKEALYWPVMFGGKPMGDDDAVIDQIVSTMIKAWRR